ncbi:hypothetical protein [Streptomyces sp. NPDC056255]|uniref:hypothetical protein n=1 Tax=Streptomyces sp. NPDC056255 TaxID=3345764 RepID=UPI0035D9C1D1
MADSTAVTWHHGVVLEDGRPYPMRHRLSDHAQRLPELTDRVLGLSDQECRASTAAHELGHAVLWMVQGIHVVEVGVDALDGQAQCSPPAPEKRLEWAIAVVAGERAQDRWLRETGLWTEDRAAMAELGASSDRARIFAADPMPRPGFGDGGPDYADLHALADQALDARWDTIQAALPALVREGTMTGNRLASCIGFPNPTPAARA